MLLLPDSSLPRQKVDGFHRLMTNPKEPIYVLGRNKYSNRVAQVLDIDAFVDDTTSETTYLGKPVVRMEQVPRESFLISCVVDGRALTAWDRACRRSQNVVDYLALTRLAPNLFPAVDFCDMNAQDIVKNFAYYQEIYNLLADEISRMHFKKVVLFRYTMDIEYMRGLTLAVNRQYLEDFFAWRGEEIFVDGGGYDGETTLRFIERYGTYRCVNYFEPSHEMMDVSRKRLHDFRDIRFYQKGLFSQNTRLPFNSQSGSASHLSENGDTLIDVVCLDDEIEGQVSSIKLDIEGAEYDALLGSKLQIKRNHPRLAICVYHNQLDFWRVPQLILSLWDGYDVYFRHYSEGTLESVMYFVPAAQI